MKKNRAPAKTGAFFILFYISIQSGLLLNQSKIWGILSILSKIYPSCRDHGKFFGNKC